MIVIIYIVNFFGSWYFLPFEVFSFFVFLVLLFSVYLQGS